MRVVFDHGNVMAPRDFPDRIHLASDAGVVNNQDRLCAWRDQTLQQFFVQVQCVRPYVYEDRTGTPEDERVSNGDESKGGDDHLVPWLNVQQQRGHLQCVGTGSRKQRLRYAQLTFK